MSDSDWLLKRKFETGKVDNNDAPVSQRGSFFVRKIGPRVVFNIYDEIHNMGDEISKHLCHAITSKRTGVLEA